MLVKVNNTDQFTSSQNILDSSVSHKCFLKSPVLTLKTLLINLQSLNE